MTAMRSRRWTLLLAMVLLAAVVTSTLQVFAATEDDLARLKTGMSKDEVIQIMGRPDSQGEKKDDNLCSWLTYKNVGRYKYINVWFDCQDKMVAIDKASR